MSQQRFLLKGGNVLGGKALIFLLPMAALKRSQHQFPIRKQMSLTLKAASFCQVLLIFILTCASREEKTVRR